MFRTGVGWLLGAPVLTPPTTRQVPRFAIGAPYGLMLRVDNTLSAVTVRCSRLFEKGPWHWCSALRLQLLTVFLNPELSFHAHLSGMPQMPLSLIMLFKTFKSNNILRDQARTNQDCNFGLQLPARRRSCHYDPSHSQQSYLPIRWKQQTASSSPRAYVPASRSHLDGRRAQQAIGIWQEMGPKLGCTLARHSFADYIRFRGYWYHSYSTQLLILDRKDEVTSLASSICVGRNLSE